MIGLLNPEVMMDAFVRASAGILMMAHPDNPREAKLTAAMVDTWTPEFVAAVQRRIDRAHEIHSQRPLYTWKIDAAKLRAYHAKLVAAGIKPCLDLPR